MAFNNSGWNAVKAAAEVPEGMKIYQAYRMLVDAEYVAKKYNDPSLKAISQMVTDCAVICERTKEASAKRKVAFQLKLKAAEAERLGCTPE